MYIKLPCYRCRDIECVGEMYDWCICPDCDMREDYSKLVNQYIELSKAEKWDEALEVHKELDTMYASIKVTDLKEVTI